MRHSHLKTRLADTIKTKNNLQERKRMGLLEIAIHVHLDTVHEYLHFPSYKTLIQAPSSMPKVHTKEDLFPFPKTPR